ncbi:MAG: 2-isopropylmalate synthase [Candidatus Gracilibacteria bacterium]
MNKNTPNTISIDEKVAEFGELAKKKYKIPANSDFKLPDRTWPDKDIEKAPIWCSVDLRDGNQSIEKPMNVEQKLEYFNMLVQMGFKEIEVGFPAASTDDYDFIRKIIEENLIPDDVKIQVLVGCKRELIEKTRKSIEGAKNVIVHLYNSTSTIQREVVFEKSQDEIIKLAEDGVDWIKKYFKDFDGNLQLEYSPESFTGTEIKFAVEICKRVINKWDSFGGKDIIFNLPATVENSTPDRYADKIEYMSRELKSYIKKISETVKVIISVHTHNDRGTAIAATELAIKAGADRVEGIIGVPNGERSGNVDIGTVALNMFTQGVSPGLDLSNIGEISEKISEIIEIPIHPRYPYTGELVHTAYSGGHIDAIAKGLDKQEEREKKGNLFWDVPYLPINPKDIGLEYEPVGINSQSGIGGVKYKLKKMGYDIPKEMKESIKDIFTPIIEEISGVLTPEKIKDIFEKNFVNINGPISIDEFDFDQIREDGRKNGHGTINEASNYIGKIFGIQFEIIYYSQESQSEGKNANAVTYFKIEYNEKLYFGFGIDIDYEKSAMKGLISTINIALRK